MKKYLVFCLIIIFLVVIELFSVTATNLRTVAFSGYEWQVKSGFMGPGPNYWNNNISAVFVDTQGLHLWVTNKEGKWYSSEVYLPSSLGYGTYEFEIDSDVTKIDANLVFSPFLYADDTHEIDVEYTKWKNEVKTNTQFVVQPFNVKGNMMRFTLLPSESVVQRIVWLPEKIHFELLQEGKIVQQFDYTGQNNFVPGKEKVHINFWMYQATPPMNGKEAEVVIKRFGFTPWLNVEKVSVEKVSGKNVGENVSVEKMNVTKVVLPVVSSNLSVKSEQKVTQTKIVIQNNSSIKSKVKVTNKNNWYKPTPGISWQLQLSGKINQKYNVKLYDIDLVETPQKVIDNLHKKNIKVICYFSAGSWENFRDDADKFPAEVLGKTLEGWPDEKWLDVAHYEKFASVIQSRLDLAVQKKCDGVDPDNVDGYKNDNGFSLTYNDQIRYNKWLAKEAHKRGLSIGLKNDLDQVKDLVNDFDFAVNEQCFQYNECNKLLPFIKQNKAVLGVEYELETKAFCKKAKSLKFSWLKMDYDLDGSRSAC